MKRVIPLIAATLATSLVLAACGSDATPAASTPGSVAAPAASTPGATPAASTPGSVAAPAGEQLPATTIKVLAPSYADSSEADWRKIIAGFKSVQPNVTVELQIEPWEGFTDKVTAKIAAKDVPDILNDNNFGEAADDLLYPINEVLSPETVSAIEPALTKNGQGADGTQWAAPDIATARLLIYNTDMFKKAGIAAPPKTWAEMLDAATKLKAIGGGVAGYGMPLGKEEAQAESTVWVWGAGGDWVDGENLKADSPAAVEGFTEMKKFIDAGVTQPNVGASNRQNVADLFNQGKIGMYVGHSGLTAETRKKFPKIKFDVAPIPSKSGEGISYGVTDFILAFKTDDARKAATKAFLDYFYAPEQYGPWYAGTGLLPVTTAAIATATKDDKINAPYYEALKTVQFTPSGNPQWSALQTALQTTAGKLQSSSPQDVLKEVQAQVDAGG